MVEMKHFVLVHGFGHGAWCWYKLVPVLESKGHRVTALDLGGCGIHPKQLHEVSTMHDYALPLFDFMANLPNDEKVILVGHSYGGIVISLAMEKFHEKISFAVYVTAYMPNWNDPPATLVQEFFKRSSTRSLMDTKLSLDEGPEHVPTSALFGSDYMAAILYRNCTLEDLELAKMLIRPNSFFLEDLSKKSLLTEERYGKIRRVYVICEDDEVMEEEFQRYNIEKSPPDNVISIAGAGHMVMLSKTNDFCFSLHELAEKYC
ncbi:hypothetical protein ACJIZ3_008117 [Penstemon smallii]|uniref:AB hydrolase-1 domain-containing protein n=1 Tax=Penstemon smallii TaxID=265156 RepID=A0ABD3T9S0_9LAMI